jgi:carbon storage regulator CsrA
MLVLSRKIGDDILIGDDIKITLISKNQGCIKVGIDAPKDVRILRGELERRDDRDSSKECV